MEADLMTFTPPAQRRIDVLLNQFQAVVAEILALAPGRVLDLFRILSQASFVQPSREPHYPPTMPARGLPRTPETSASVRLERRLFPESRNKSILGSPLRSFSPCPEGYTWDSDYEDKPPQPDINWSA